MNKFISLLAIVVLAVFVSACASDDESVDVVEVYPPLIDENIDIVLRSKVSQSDFDQKIKNCGWVDWNTYEIDPKNGKRAIWDIYKGGYDEEGKWHDYALGGKTVVYCFEDDSYMECSDGKCWKYNASYDEKTGTIVKEGARKVDFYIESVNEDTLNLVSVTVGFGVNQKLYYHKVFRRMEPDVFNIVKETGYIPRDWWPKEE